MIQNNYTEVILKVYTDGGSRGNPGHSAIGYYIEKDRVVLKQEGVYLGIGTNNEAEHLAIKTALSWILENIDKPMEIVCRLDSELVVNQLLGKYKLKNPRLAAIAADTFKIIKQLQQKGYRINFIAIPRELNKTADYLVNQALDDYFKSVS